MFFLLCSRRRSHPQIGGSATSDASMNCDRQGNLHGNTIAMIDADVPDVLSSLMDRNAIYTATSVAAVDRNTIYTATSVAAVAQNNHNCAHDNRYLNDTKQDQLVKQLDSNYTKKIRSIVRRIVVIDDNQTILQVVRKLLCNFFTGAIIETILINSPVSYEHFVSRTIPEQHHDWDIVLMDQDLILSNNSTKFGTDLIRVLKSFKCNACIMMHSANTGPEDISLYKSAGADGFIKKCSKTLCYEVHNAFRKTKTSQQ